MHQYNKPDQNLQLNDFKQVPIVYFSSDQQFGSLLIVIIVDL
jgi:hypothetical protein